jgi:excisionase family DNA binding protein
MADEVLLRPEVAADRLSLSRARVYELLATGQIESIKIGRSRRIPVSALVRFIERQREEQAVPA